MLSRHLAATPACSVLANNFWFPRRHENGFLSLGWRSYWSGQFFHTPLKHVWKVYGPPLTDTALIFLTNSMISELHLNYFLVSFSLFQGCIGCTVTILICGWRLLLLSNMMGDCATSCLESQRNLFWTCGFIREGSAESAFTCLASSTVFHSRICSFSV